MLFEDNSSTYVEVVVLSYHPPLLILLNQVIKILLKIWIKSAASVQLQSERKERNKNKDKMKYHY